MIKYPLLLASLLLYALATAQESLPLPRNLSVAYEKGTRSHDGQPGARYWQNRADYNIDLRFDPATRLISGVANIVYFNNSPDTLKNILFKLYPNLYRKGAERDMAISPEDAGEGMRIEHILVNEQESAAQRRMVRGTNMFLQLDQALAPRQFVKLKVQFNYNLNKDSHIRTGEVDPGAWFVAYFFPRIAVYDDLTGWNAAPYTGSREFYNDFCNFQLNVTVPKSYAVWATGTLNNAESVYNPAIAKRIAAAEQSARTIDIIDTSDLKNNRVTADKPENTFRFEADEVVDVVFAVSNHYIWKSVSTVVDSATGRRTVVNAVFNPEHRDFYEVIDFARKTVEAMSFRFPRWPFPFPHMTVFDGLDQMEYPMMANDNPLEDRAESIELTDHEIMHMMFPFYMGTNETKYGWMDEGWATLGEWLISPMIDSSIVDLYGMNQYESLAGTESDQEITTLTTQQTGASLFINSYPKPALGYLYAMDILGEERFYKGLHHYIRTWHGKHPMPFDFFNCMNTGSGVNLNWFWKRWFFEGGVPDLAITKVNNSAKEKEILIEAIGAKPVPLDLLLEFTDGRQEEIHYSPAIWEKGARNFIIKINSDKALKSIRLGSDYVPDVNKKDNFWKG